jgi:hypothetical protein
LACNLPLLTTQQNIHASRGIFFIYLYFFVMIGLALPFVLYCTTHTIQTFMPLVGFEPETPVSDRPQTLALDRSATGIGIQL